MHIVVQVMLQLDLHLAETVVSMLDWGYRVIHDFGSMRTNQRPVSRSSDNSWPIRGQYSGHVVTLHQSKASIWIPWWLSTNQMQLTRSNNHSPPIRGQFSGPLIFITNRRPVSKSSDLSRLISAPMVSSLTTEKVGRVKLSFCWLDKFLKYWLIK